uniref:Uncharacterized protein n=1 Tax=Helianthus annuus TaxID=4232 RepID=A0A251TE83_HELAN
MPPPFTTTTTTNPTDSQPHIITRNLKLLTKLSTLPLRLRNEAQIGNIFTK